MRLEARRQQLDALLLATRELWHPQPFREPRPAWCARYPALSEALLALPEAAVVALNDDGAAAASLLAAHCPAVGELAALIEVPAANPAPVPALGAHWAWEIPGRKRQQIEAFASAIDGGTRPVIDWCGGKGHLGRLLALNWPVPVHSLDINAVLCAEGRALARRANVTQTFVEADALRVADWPRAGQHAVALHACGDLHRRLIAHGAEAGLARLDVAPCCYYRGVETDYTPLSDGVRLVPSRDDARLAVTETVTASARETRQRDREMAWKLGFDAYRRALGAAEYRSFKPVPEAWMRSDFADYMVRMTAREGLPTLAPGAAAGFEAAGWQRRHEVMRLSVVRHAFRRALELWLVLDLAVFLERQGYAVTLQCFCARALTPRNLLLSAQRA